MESSAIGFRCPGWQPESHPSTDAMSYSRLLPIESISGQGSHHQHEGLMSIASELIKPGKWPPISLLSSCCSARLFMTLAWYGNLKFKAVSLVIVVLVSWGHRLRGILFRGARQQDRQRCLFAGRAQDDPGSDYADRVCGLHRNLFRRTAQLDAGRGLCPDRSRCRARLPWPDLSEAASSNLRKADAARSIAGTTRPERRFPPPE